MHLKISKIGFKILNSCSVIIRLRLLVCSGSYSVTAEKCVRTVTHTDMIERTVVALVRLSVCLHPRARGQMMFFFD